jgi:hypothetical protein
MSNYQKYLKYKKKYNTLKNTIINSSFVLNKSALHITLVWQKASIGNNLNIRTTIWLSCKY